MDGESLRGLPELLLDELRGEVHALRSEFRPIRVPEHVHAIAPVDGECHLAAPEGPPAARALRRRLRRVDPSGGPGGPVVQRLRDEEVHGAFRLAVVVVAIPGEEDPEEEG